MAESKSKRRSDSQIKSSPAARITIAILAVIIFAADQISKSMVMHRIHEREVVRVIPGCFNLINSKNSGAIFGMFNDSAVWWKTPVLIVVSVVLLAVVALMIFRTQNLHWGTSIGLGLVLGGALGNLFDRIHAGEVEDFLDFYYRSYHWATFNLADSAIVVGTGLIILQILSGD